MNAIRHHLFVLAGLIVIGALAGWRPAVWVAGGLALSIGTHSLAAVVGKRRGSSRWTLPLVLLFTVLGLALALGSAVVVFLRTGWIPAIGFLSLFLGFFLTREDRDGALTQVVQRIRTTVLEDLTKEIVGHLTKEQLIERTVLALEDHLPSETYDRKLLYDPLLEQSDLSVGDYRYYLEILDQCLLRTGHDTRFSRLHQELRTRLGIPPYLKPAD